MTEQSAACVDSARYFVINGRSWRKTDPAIPSTLQTQLVKELMSARRTVKSAKTSGDDDAVARARARASDAKISLGERGRPWWEAPTEESLQKKPVRETRQRVRLPQVLEHQAASTVKRIINGL